MLAKWSSVLGNSLGMHYWQRQYQIISIAIRNRYHTHDLERHHRY